MTLRKLNCNIERLNLHLTMIDILICMCMYLRIFLNMYFCIFLNTHSFSLEICVFYVTLCISSQHSSLLHTPFGAVSCSPTAAEVGGFDLAPIYFFPPLCFSLLCAPVNVENFNIFLPQEKLRHTKAQPERHISPHISPPFTNLAPISDL